MFSLERERKAVSLSTPNVLVWSLGDFRQVNVRDIATFGTGFSPPPSAWIASSLMEGTERRVYSLTEKEFRLLMV